MIILAGKFRCEDVTSDRSPKDSSENRNRHKKEGKICDRAKKGPRKVPNVKQEKSEARDTEIIPHPKKEKKWQEDKKRKKVGTGRVQAAKGKRK